MRLWVVFVITRISLNRGSLIKSRLCSIHFTVILAGLKKIVRLYTEDFVISVEVQSLNRGSTVDDFPWLRPDEFLLLS